MTPAPRPRASLNDVTVERVLRCVEAIPAGRVAAYGQIGTIVGLGPRQVGRIMANWGSNAPWWRVTSASGTLPAPLLARAAVHWEREGIEMATSGRGCRIRAHQADLARLAADTARAIADLD